MSDVVIAGYARSPFHLAHKGALAKVRPDDLAASTILGLIERTGVNPDDIEDLLPEALKMGEHLLTLPPASRNRRAALSTRTAFFQLSLFRLDWDADLDLNSGPDVVPGSSARPTS